jgi:hypothetical protein
MLEYLTTLPPSHETAQLIGMLAPTACHHSDLADADRIRDERAIVLLKRLKLVTVVDHVKHKRTEKFELLAEMVVQDWEWLNTPLYEVMVHELKRQAVLGCLHVPCENREKLSQMTQMVHRLLPASAGLVTDHVRSDLLRLVHRCKREPFQTVAGPYLLAHSIDHFVSRFIKWAEALQRSMPLALEAVHVCDNKARQRKQVKRQRQQEDQQEKRHRQEEEQQEKRRRQEEEQQEKRRRQEEEQQEKRRRQQEEAKEKRRRQQEEAKEWGTVSLRGLKEWAQQDGPAPVGGAATEASLRARRWLKAVEELQPV